MCTSSEDNSTPPEDSPNACPNDSAIYDHFWRRCRPTVHGRDCNGRPVYTWCRKVPEDWEPIVAELLETFGPERLETSGIAQHQEDGQWSMAPAVVPGGYVVALREEEDEPIFEILTHHGGLLGEDIPVIAALRDHRFRDWGPKMGGRLLACASINQVPPFLGLCLPVTTLHGLTDLNLQTLGSELQYLGWRILDPNQQSGQFTDPLRLVLVAWDPRTKRIRQYPEVREAAQFLANAERYWRLESHSAVWLPSEEEVRKFQFLRDCGDLNGSREALVESLDNSSYAISAFLDPNFTPRHKPENFIEAYTELEKCIRAAENHAVTAERLQEAEETFARFVDEDLVQPLFQQALENDDPLLRNLGVIVAGSFRTFHRQSPYLERDGIKSAKGELSSEDLQRVSRQVSQQQRTVANIMRFAEKRNK